MSNAYLNSLHKRIILLFMPNQKLILFLVYEDLSPLIYSAFFPISANHHIFLFFCQPFSLVCKHFYWFFFLPLKICFLQFFQNVDKWQILVRGVCGYITEFYVYVHLKIYNAKAKIKTKNLYWPFYSLLHTTSMF